MMVGAKSLRLLRFMRTVKTIGNWLSLKLVHCAVPHSLLLLPVPDELCTVGDSVLDTWLYGGCRHLDTKFIFLCNGRSSEFVKQASQAATTTTTPLTD